MKKNNFIILLIYHQSFIKTDLLFKIFQKKIENDK